MRKIDLAVGATVAAIVAGAAWGYYAESVAPTFELRKDAWKCARSVVVVLPHSHDECIEYRREAPVGSSLSDSR